jgi:integrase
MAKKRGNGEGSIHKRANGNWEVQVSLEGRRLGRTFGTQRECQEWLKKTRGQIDDGMTFSSTKLRLGEYLSSWLSSSKTSLRQSTWIHYDQLNRQYITPGIGYIRLKDLKTEHVQGFYNRLLEEGVGIHTVLYTHAVLHRALEQAVKASMLTRNPASYTQLPKKPVTEMEILTESQVSQFLIAAKGHRLDALFHLALITGARQMELLGLKWSDLDWVKQTLKIERQLLRPDGDGVKFSAPKTRYGRRLVALGSKTIEVLRKHYDFQRRERLAAGEHWNEYGLIFTSRVGTPIHYYNLLDNFHDLLKCAGLPIIHFHSLRHTCASLLLNQGVPVIEVSRRLGHSRASITLDVYGHLIPGMQSEVADLIDELVMPVAIQIDQKVS